MSERFLYLDTPLGKQLLLNGFSGSEGISRLFSFDVDVMAENAKPVAFDKLIGQKVGFGVVEADEKRKYRDFHGIVVELSEGVRSRGQEFTCYQMRVVPEIWKLSCTHRSRIFQHITIPDLLKELFKGFEVSYDQIQGQYEPREYITQYQESDLNFACRLMEEEGISYFFQFTRGTHKLVLTDASQGHPYIPGDSKVIFEEWEGGVRDEERITSWRKQQLWGAATYSWNDYHFQLPTKNLAVSQEILDTVSVGKVSHKLKLGGNETMEVYDHSGRYAQRFDGIDKAGGEQEASLEKVFPDKDRTSKIRTQQAEGSMLLISGESYHRQMIAGHKFTLERHYDADGNYVITSVQHQAREGDYHAGQNQSPGYYKNSFTCVPFVDPFRFRPPSETHRSFIPGPQTAVVVGPKGEEIFTDKYGRVKVQFYWDREGKKDANSSCWLRVLTPSAGAKWGTISIPRIGQEVMVGFQEGDPDRPIILGSVYNADMMPPYDLPANKTQSGTKTRTSTKGGAQNFNQILFEDKKDQEQVHIHAERTMLVSVEGNQTNTVGGSRYTTIGGGAASKSGVCGNAVDIILKNQSLEIKENYITKVEGKVATSVTGAEVRSVTGAYALASKDAILIDAQEITLHAKTKITLIAGGASIVMDAGGVTIVGPMIKLNPPGAPPPVAPTVPQVDPPLKIPSE